MAAPSNLSFEDPDATPGSALGWTLTATSSVEVVADFDAGTLPYEPFDGWDAGFKFFFNGVAPAVDFDLVAASMTTLHTTPKHAEDFEELWLADQTALFDFDSVPRVQATFRGPCLAAGETSLLATIAMPAVEASLVIPVVANGAFTYADVVKAVGNFGIVDENGDMTIAALKLRGLDGVDHAINMSAIESTFGEPFPTHKDIDLTTDLAAVTGALGGNWTFKYRDTEDSGNRFLSDVTVLFFGATVTWEDFNSGWTNDVFFNVYDFDALGFNALAGADPFDWAALLDEWTDVSGTATSATFYLDGFGNPINHEDFEAVHAPLEFSVDLSTDFFTIVGHGIGVGEIVRFQGDGVLPAPLQRDTDYFVTDTTTDDFRVSYVSGGATVDVTANGSGAIRIVRDAGKFWTKLMQTL